MNPQCLAAADKKRSQQHSIGRGWQHDRAILAVFSGRSANYRLFNFLAACFALFFAPIIVSRSRSSVISGAVNKTQGWFIRIHS
jgi:hypothetical protein